MNFEEMTVEELETMKETLVHQIEEFEHCLELMPRTTVLGVLSLKSTIRKKDKALHFVLAELAYRDMQKMKKAKNKGE